MFQDVVGSTTEALFCTALCTILACVEDAINCVTVDIVLLDGTWKKYSINPAANSRCIPKITATYIILCLPVKSIVKFLFISLDIVIPIWINFFSQSLVFINFLHILDSLLPAITGNNDRSKTPPDKNVTNMTRPHCNQLIWITHRKATGT